MQAHRGSAAQSSSRSCSLQPSTESAMEGVRRVRQKRDLGEPEPTASQAKYRRARRGWCLSACRHRVGLQGRDSGAR
eukprot:4510797-Prymnesium_polylepis.1